MARKTTSPCAACNGIVYSSNMTILNVFVFAFVRDHSIHAVDMRREAAQLDLLRLALGDEPRVRVSPLDGHLNVAVRVCKDLKGA